MARGYAIDKQSAANWMTDFGRYRSNTRSSRLKDVTLDDPHRLLPGSAASCTLGLVYCSGARVLNIARALRSRTRRSTRYEAGRTLPNHDGVRGHGLCRGRACERDLDHNRDRQEANRSGRICGSSTPLGGREVFRLAQPQPTALEGPGDDAHIRQGLPIRRVRNAPHPPIGPGFTEQETECGDTASVSRKALLQWNEPTKSLPRSLPERAQGREWPHSGP
jgi:hypothetical protein